LAFIGQKMMTTGALMPNTIKATARWKRITRNLWEYRQGHVVFSSGVEIDGQFKVLNVGLLDRNKYTDLEVAKKAAEDYWEAQDVNV